MTTGLAAKTAKTTSTAVSAARLIAKVRSRARSAALSSSATTRLVNRLEMRGFLSRYLCADDRRGIYTEVTEAGLAALQAAGPDHDAALERALEAARGIEELRSLAESLG
ncbi:MarR family transcriptional regulator [Arthrobacter russicus]